MTAYFAYLCAEGRRWVESVSVPPGGNPDLWFPQWWAGRIEGGCRQIEPITRAEYNRCARAAK